MTLALVTCIFGNKEKQPKNKYRSVGYFVTDPK
jgi:hypothetical protein